MVSVLINNHNYGEFIGEAIESVINQTYQDFELIIVDGDSSDNSRDVIMKYCNKYPDKITVVFKPTSGQAAAFNVGYKLSKGNIIAFLDSDDYWFPDKLEKIVEAHKKYKFVGHYGRTNSPKRELSDAKLAGLDKVNYNEKDRPRLLKEYGYTYTYGLTSTAISGTRDLFEKIFPMPEDGYTVCADHHIKLLALYYDNIKIIDDELYFYRLHGRNALFENDIFEESYIIDLDYHSIELINKKLEKEGLPLIPHIDKELYKKMLEDIGINFSIESGKEYALYGSGKYGRNVKEYIESLGAKVKCFSDSNESKWGQEVEGVKVISPKELLEKRNEYEKVLITSTWFKEIASYLDGLGFDKSDYMYVEMGIDYTYFAHKNLQETMNKIANMY